MTALTLDQLLETEALFYRVARTGLDDFLKEDLTQVVLSTSGDHTEHERSQLLLRPMVMRDDQCRAAQGMLCRAIRLKLAELTGSPRLFFGASGIIRASSVERAELVNRRLHMMVASVRAYLEDEPGHAWQIVEPCTTADRLIVLGFTAVILRRAVTGDVDLNPDFGTEDDEVDA